VVQPRFLSAALLPFLSSNLDYADGDWLMHWMVFLAQGFEDPRSAWAPVVLLIAIGLIVAVGSIAASLLIGPKRTGEVKSQTYESGMVPVGDARQRFNVRFYLMAMIFLVFDVEIVFFYPWATIYPQSVSSGQGGFLLFSMIIFVTILLVAYLYAWGKGIFRWD
jgi:NADH-quinone oxidoreductase subunit A